MTEVVFTFWDLEIMYLEFMVGMLIYAVLRSYLDRKWKKWKKWGDME